jgi:hypothetical protein
MRSGVGPKDCKWQTARANSSACTSGRFRRDKGRSFRFCRCREKAQCPHFTVWNLEDKDQTSMPCGFSAKGCSVCSDNCLAPVLRI